MKILMVINCLCKGGRERRVLELIKGLKEKNKDFDIYLISLNPLIEYPMVYDLPIKFEIINKKSKDLGLIFKLRKIIKNFNPDVIHSWDVMSSAYLSAANIFINKKLVNGVIYNAALNSDLYERDYFKVRLFTAISDVTVANSQAGIKAFKVSPKKSVCIYNGINLKRFENLKPEREVELDLLNQPKGDRFIAAMVGAFEERKDYDTLIKAAIKLCSERRNVVFLLIGKGTLMNSIREQVPEQMLNSQIYFLGSRNDIESILQIVDVGLLITPCEGLSNSIIEYMASSMPVIASRDGGTPELVLDGETGFLVDQKRPDQIIEKMSLLMDNPQLAKAMGKNGRERIEQHFNIANMTESYIDLYSKLVNGKKKAEVKIPSVVKVGVPAR